MNDKKDLKPFPRFASDEEAEHFVDTADLSTYDFSDMKPMQFEFSAKDSRINMRIPTSLLDEVKASAARSGIPYQRFIRQLIEAGLTGKR